MAGHSHGIDWNSGGRLERVRDLIIAGNTSKKAAEILTKEWGVHVTKAMIDGLRQRYDIPNYFIEERTDVKYYESDTLPMDNYMISCDDHSPYFNALYQNRLLMIAQFFGIKKHIKVGDLIDQSYIKSWAPKEGEKQSTLDEEIEQSEPLIKALDYFDRVYLVRGNHEGRVTRATDAKIQAKHILLIFGQRIHEKIEYTPYDKLFIGDKWMVVHPKSYSQVSGSTAVRLAEKFQRNVLNAHGHFSAFRYTRSGEHLGVDLGGMFNIHKIGYINLSTTTHPAWNNGFAMLRNGKAWLFNESTDWDFWGRQGR